MLYVLGIVPFIFARLALSRGGFPYKAGVTLSCLTISLLAREMLGFEPAVLFVPAAFGFSVVGDFFLSHKKRHRLFYLYGVAAYFMAHVGYLLFALSYGTVNRWVLVIVGAAYLLYYVTRLSRALPSKGLATAVLFYLIISCVSLAAAVGVTLAMGPKLLLILGIALIVISDTLIAENDFCGNGRYRKAILPTYYLAQIAITYAVVWLH